MKIGIIQQHNGKDVKTNVLHLVTKIRQLAKEGAELIVLQELHNSLYFCKQEDVNLFDLAETIPGWPRSWASSSSPRCSNVVLPACITIRLSFWRRTAR